MAGLYGTFEQRLRRLMADAPGNVSINSGYRSVDRQRQLWQKALRKYGSAEAADNWVAPPGNSMHNHGFAADLKYASNATKRWVHANAGKYGLHFPLSNEDWHIELAKPGGGRYSTSEAQQLRGSGGDSGHVHGSGGGVEPAATVLKRDSRGGSVKSAQKMLQSMGLYQGALDGIYGPKTEQAVKRYQQSQGLRVDGVIGPNTWGALSGTNDRPSLPSQITRNTGDNVAPLPRTDFKGPGAEQLMTVTDNLGKTFLINTSDESRYPVTGPGALNAALKLTGQKAPVKEFGGKPVYLSNWKQGPNVIELFGGPNQMERVVAGHKKLPGELGGRYIADPQRITTGSGETFEPENRYPSEPTPLPADILAQFEERRRRATRGVEEAQIEAQRQREQSKARFQQFKNRLAEQAKNKKRDLALEGANRNLAFQPAFMGRGQRTIRDQRADRMGQRQSERAQRLSALDSMVSKAKRRRESELAAIDREKATLRPRPEDYMQQQGVR